MADTSETSWLKQQVDELEKKVRRHRTTIHSCTPSFFSQFERVREFTLSLEDPDLPWPPFLLASSLDGELFSLLSIKSQSLFWTKSNIPRR